MLRMLDPLTKEVTTLVYGNGKAPWPRFPWPLACLSLASACLSQLYLLQSLSRFLKIGQLVRNYPVPTEYDREEAWRSRIVAEKAGAFLRSRTVRCVSAKPHRKVRFCEAAP
jgi:hypothetical protein